MRKNLNKIVAFAIGVSVISGSIVPAMAESVDNKIDKSISVNNISNDNILTLEKAFEGAKSKSNTLAILDKNIQLLQSTNSIVDKIDNVKDSDDDYTDDKSKLTLDKLEQTRIFELDKLKQSVTNAYNDLVISSKEIDKLKKDIELQKEEIEQAKLKRSLGLTTDIDIDKVQIELKNNENTLINNENLINDKKYNFKVLTGQDVDKYKLEDIIRYKKFEIDGTLNEYLDGIIEEYTNYSEELNKLEKDHWNDDDYKVTNSDVQEAYEKYKDTSDDNKAPDLTFEPDDNLEKQAGKIKTYISKLKSFNDDTSNYLSVLNNRISYLQNKSSAEVSEIQLNEAKDQYKEKLRSIYTDLIKTEKNIDLIKAKVELKNKQTRIDKINYDLGLMTKLSYDKSVSDSDTLNNQLLSTIDTYNKLKSQLEKPWIGLS
ncbi:TolC family protein [Clostridium butyricum]|uniref:TolC family protein n=1 Tax=Clostridium butyricum TaxID=1492 RepID=UPI0002C8F127|nr:TolC family protein [Clostridium butyricum]EMU53095.1 hypothetical protein CBDKU1_28700 [Clostridium butyricum DKU-01]